MVLYDRSVISKSVHKVLFLFGFIVLVGVCEASPQINLAFVGSTIKFSPTDESADNYPTPETRRLSRTRSETKWVELVEPRNVEAGFTPEWRQYFYASSDRDITAMYPAIKKLPRNQRRIARSLRPDVGYGELICHYLPGYGQYVSFLRNKPIAFVLADLKKAGYSYEKNVTNVDLKSKHYKHIAKGLLDIMHIVVEVPGYDHSLPTNVQLNLKYIEHDQDKVIDVEIDLVAREKGDYYLKDLNEVDSVLFQELRVAMELFAGGVNQDGYGREIRFVQIQGFNDNTVKIENLPPVEGAVLTHRVYFGSWLATSGWQWYGRPEGVYGTHDDGFVSP